MLRGLLCSFLTCFSLFGVGHGSIPYPLAIFPGRFAGFQAFLIAGTIAFDHIVELIPVDLTKIIMATLFIPFQVRIRNGETQDLGLFHGYIYHFLAKLIICETLDPPAHALSGVRAIGIIRAGHQKRLKASCAIFFCTGVPLASVIMISKPWRWWKLSSLHTRTIALE